MSEWYSTSVKLYFNLRREGVMSNFIFFWDKKMGNSWSVLVNFSGLRINKPKKLFVSNSIQWSMHQQSFPRSANISEEVSYLKSNVFTRDALHSQTSEALPGPRWLPRARCRVMFFASHQYLLRSEACSMRGLHDNCSMIFLEVRMNKLYQRFGKWRRCTPDDLCKVCPWRID